MSLKLTATIIALFAILIASCSNRIDESSIEAGLLCPLAETAFAKQDFGDLLLTLEKKFHVEKEKLRITQQGVFIPVKNRFVEEDGYFLAKPGVNIIIEIGDPAFVRVKGCIYRYHIKG
jgi:hypothetical protein